MLVALAFSAQAPAPLSPAFPFLDAMPDSLAWSGATVGSIGSARFSFALDVPDGLQAFTLRQIPIVTPVPVPEPATGALLVLAIAGLGVAIRNRNAHSADQGPRSIVALAEAAGEQSVFPRAVGACGPRRHRHEYRNPRDQSLSPQSSSSFKLLETGNRTFQ